MTKDHIGRGDGEGVQKWTPPPLTDYELAVKFALRDAAPARVGIRELKEATGLSQHRIFLGLHMLWARGLVYCQPGRTRTWRWRGADGP